jgi:hypothetical protein
MISMMDYAFVFNSVTYLTLWRCDHIYRGRCGLSCRGCGCEYEGCASLKEMIHLHWETTASPEGGVASPAGDAVSRTRDLLASPNFGICDTTLCIRHFHQVHLGCNQHSKIWIRVATGPKKTKSVLLGRSKSLSRLVRTGWFTFIHRTGPFTNLLIFFDRSFYLKESKKSIKIFECIFQNDP